MVTQFSGIGGGPVIIVVVQQRQLYLKSYRTDFCDFFFYVSAWCAIIKLSNDKSSKNWFINLGNNEDEEFMLKNRQSTVYYL